MSQDSGGATIPRIIHQIWYQGVGAIPDRFRRYIVGWKRMHPDWEYRIWDQAACRTLLAERFPDFLPIWDRYPLTIQRIDSIRYFILSTYGGIYLDMDTECLKPLDPLLQDCDFLLSKTVQYNNAVMASSPGHEFWPHVFRNLVAASEQARPVGIARWWSGDPIYAFKTAGPLLFSSTIAETGIDTRPRTRVCPGYIFEPRSPTLRNGRLAYDLDTSRSYAIHHETMGWLPTVYRSISLIGSVVFRFILTQRRGSTHE